MGQIIGTTPKPDEYISIDISGRQNIFKIIGIERGNPDEYSIIRIGLLLAIDDSNMIKYISDNKVKDQVATIFALD